MDVRKVFYTYVELEDRIDLHTSRYVELRLTGENPDLLERHRMAKERLKK